MNTQLHLSKKLFNDVYYPYLFDYGNRVEIYYGGAGSGKSVFIAQKILVKALQEKRRVLIIRKTMASQRDSCWQLFLDLLSKWKIKQLCIKVNYSNYYIILPNGSELLFKGLDDSEKIKSITNITDIWTEEATELTEEDFEQLDLRLRAEVDNLQIFVSFNPISKANWVYKRWFENGTKDFVLKTTYKDNKFLPDDYIKALENKILTNPTYYKIYALGEFCSLDKLIYNNWKVQDFNSNQVLGELICGLDFGYTNDLTAFVCSLVDSINKKIYIFKNWTATGKTNEEICKAITSLGFSKSTIIADSAEPKSIEELRRYGLYRIKASVKGPDSIMHGIQKLQEYEIIVHPSCDEIITELENYSWQKDKKTGEYINKPIDDFNHSLDALRYSLQCIDKGKLRTVNKNLLGL